MKFGPVVQEEKSLRTDDRQRMITIAHLEPLGELKSYCLLSRLYLATSLAD